jgi:hypothetical protein
MISSGFLVHVVTTGFQNLVSKKDSLSLPVLFLEMILSFAVAVSAPQFEYHWPKLTFMVLFCHIQSKHKTEQNTRNVYLMYIFLEAIVYFCYHWLRSPILFFYFLILYATILFFFDPSVQQMSGPLRMNKS